MGKRAYEPMKPDSDDDADKSEQPWQRRARGDEVGPSGQAHTATSSASAPSSASGTTYPSSVLNQAFYYGRSNSILDNPTAPPAKQLGASVPPFTLKDLTPRATKEQLASRKILKALRPGIQSTAEKVGPKPKNPWQFVDLTTNSPVVGNNGSAPTHSFAPDRMAPKNMAHGLGSTHTSGVSGPSAGIANAPGAKTGSAAPTSASVAHGRPPMAPTAKGFVFSNTKPHAGPPMEPNTNSPFGMAHGNAAAVFGNNQWNGAAADTSQAAAAASAASAGIKAAGTNGASSARSGVNKEFDSTNRPTAATANSPGAFPTGNGPASAQKPFPGSPMAPNVMHQPPTPLFTAKHPTDLANSSKPAASANAFKATTSAEHNKAAFRGPAATSGASSAPVANNAPSAAKSKGAIGATATPSSPSFTPPHVTAGFGVAINNGSSSASFASNTAPVFQESSSADANAGNGLGWTTKTADVTVPPVSGTTASSSILLGHRSAFNTTGMTSPSRPSADVNHACTVKSTMHASTRHTRPGTGFKASLKTITECCESEKTQIESLSTSPPAETSVTQAGKSRSVDTATCSGTQMIVENGKESMEGSNALNDPTATLEVATSSKTGATPIARTDRLSDGPVMMPPQASSSAASSDPNKSSNTAPTAENTSVERIDGYTVEDASPESATTAAVLAVSAPSADPAAGSVGLPASDNSLVALLARHALALAGQAKNGIAPHGSLGHDPVQQNVTYQSQCTNDNSTNIHQHFNNGSATDDMSAQLGELKDLAIENRGIGIENRGAVGNLTGKVDNIQQSVQKAAPTSAWKAARNRQDGFPSSPTVLFATPAKAPAANTAAASSGVASSRSRSRKTVPEQGHSASSADVPPVSNRRETPSSVGAKKFQKGDRVWFNNRSKTAILWGTVLADKTVKGCYQVQPDGGADAVPKKPMSLHLGTDE